MDVEQRNEAFITEKEAFQAIGIRWEGTFQEAGAGGIRAIQKEMQERLHEIQQVVNPDVLLGLSYHAVPGGNGFVHYAAVEVESVEHIPVGMVEISVPSLTYATATHEKGQNIEQSYTNLYNWIHQENLQENRVGDLTHFEIYPMSQDPFDTDPTFTFMIPVV